jgi:hypothetical protein
VPADTGRTVHGVNLPGTIDVGGHTLALNGVGTRTATFLKVKVYVAALYVASTTKNAAEILAADAPRRMEMHFLRDVDKKKICEAWDEGLKNNTPKASDELKQQFVELCTLMDDIKDKQAFSFAYVPGTGTEISVAGASKGTIAGKEFADALLGCWIGPKPGPGNTFKKDLLGKS